MEAVVTSLRTNLSKSFPLLWGNFCYVYRLVNVLPSMNVHMNFWSVGFCLFGHNGSFHFWLMDSPLRMQMNGKCHYPLVQKIINDIKETAFYRFEGSPCCLLGEFIDKTILPRNYVFFFFYFQKRSQNKAAGRWCTYLFFQTKLSNAYLSIFICNMR